MARDNFCVHAQPQTFFDQRLVLCYVTFSFERREVTDSDLFDAEQTLFQNLIQSFDKTNSTAMSARGQRYELFIPWSDHLGHFFERSFVVARLLQKRIFLFDDPVIVV